MSGRLELLGGRISSKNPGVASDIFWKVHHMVRSRELEGTSVPDFGSVFDEKEIVRMAHATPTAEVTPDLVRKVHHVARS